MVNPTFADYVDLLFTLLERFWQHDSARPHRGHPVVYEHKAFQAYFPEPVWERMHAALQAQWARALVLRRQGRIHFHRDSSTLLCPGEITVAHRPFSSPDFSVRW